MQCEVHSLMFPNQVLIFRTCSRVVAICQNHHDFSYFVANAKFSFEMYYGLLLPPFWKLELSVSNYETVYMENYIKLKIQKI